MSNYDPVFANAQKEGVILYTEFAARMDNLCARGLVDCKVKLFPGPDTLTADVIRTFSNALRLLEAGMGRPLTLG
jgi:hypothetical protein